MGEEIQISRAFIEEEVPKAPPLYVSVYLMTKLFALPSSGEVAQRLGILESDVLRAWAYWKEREPKAVPAYEGERCVVLERKPEYSTAELAEYMKHKQVKQLLLSAQKKMGKPLTQQDVSMLFGFYDWLGLPVEVIEVLLSYCVSDGFKGMRYLEKVAIGWAEEGIDTVEKAAEYIEMRKSSFRQIMRAFGQSGRMPVAKEEEFMKKWLKEFGFSTEVVCLACERTVMQTGKISFPYADGILSKWKGAGVRTAADVETLDQAFQAKKNINGQEQKPAPTPQKKPKQNRFINYSQRQWDFDKLEEMERERRETW